MIHPAPGKPVPAIGANVADLAGELESLTARHMRVAYQVAAFVAAPLRSFDRHERAAILRLAGNLLDIASGNHQPVRTNTKDGSSNG